MQFGPDGTLHCCDDTDGKASYVRQHLSYIRQVRRGEAGQGASIKEVLLHRVADFHTDPD